jgi:DNA-binding NarL/FixJ family response regulator
MVESGKVLSIGLGDLVSPRNAALRRLGFDVVAAISLEEVFRLCGSSRFDVAIVGHAFSISERADFLRCIQEDFRLPVILIDNAQSLASLRADSHVHVDAPTEELVRAIERLMDEQDSTAIAV